MITDAVKPTGSSLLRKMLYYYKIITAFVANGTYLPDIEFELNYS